MFDCVLGTHHGRHSHGKVFARRSNCQLDSASALVLENARIESACFSGWHVRIRSPPGNMNIPLRMYMSEALNNDPALVLVCCCGLLCTHLRDPVPHFRRHPFSDYGLESVCVWLHICLYFYMKNSGSVIRKRVSPKMRHRVP